MRDLAVGTMRGVLLVLLTALLCVGCAPKKEALYSPGQAPPAMSDWEALSYVDTNFRITKGFSSHLPLVVIDTQGEDVLPTRRWDSAANYAVVIPGAKPYVRAVMEIFDNEGEWNSPFAAASFRSPVRIRLDDDPAVPSEKGQYRVNLVTGLNQEYDAPLLGMESGSEWALLGSDRDSSLMRDYLAFTLASKMMPFTPDIRFCEVLFRKNGELFYQGVYLFAETVQKGPGRIDIQPQTGLLKLLNRNVGGGAPEFIIRRGEFSPDSVTLDTWATREGLYDGFLSLVYPQEDVSGTMMQSIEESVSRVERMLYSSNPVVYVNYTKYIDVDTFIDYYILNEYLMNFSAGFRPVYMYQDNRGRIRVGPVWDALDSFDNSVLGYADSSKTAFFMSPWFDRMSIDIYFLTKMVDRYSALRRGVLANENVIALVDNTAKMLGAAQQRDYMRWKSAYSYGNAARLRSEPPGTYSQELVKIKYLLVEHSAIIGDEVRRMAWGSRLMDSSYSNSRSALLALGFAVLYFLAVHFGRHH